MKIMITFLSAIIIFIGIIPFLGENFIIPNGGTAYSVVLIAAGAIIFILGLANKLLMGFERFIIFLQGGAVMLIGVLPFFSTLLPFLPREGVMYPTLVILVGTAGGIYGFLGMG